MGRNLFLAHYLKPDGSISKCAVRSDCLLMALKDAKELGAKLQYQFMTIEFYAAIPEKRR